MRLFNRNRSPVWKEIYRERNLRVEIDPASAKTLAPGVGRVTFRWTWSKAQPFRGLTYQRSVEVVVYDSNRGMVRLLSVTLFDAAGDALRFGTTIHEIQYTPIIAESIGSALVHAACSLLSLDPAAFGQSRYRGFFEPDSQWFYAPTRMHIGDDAEQLDIGELQPKSLLSRIWNRPHVLYYLAIAGISWLAHAIAWKALAWAFALAAAGYLDEHGRVENGASYYRLLESALQLPEPVAWIYGILAFALVFPALKAIQPSPENGLPEITYREIRAFKICTAIAVIAWAGIGLRFAQLHAPDYSLLAALFGALLGCGAHVRVLWSVYLVRRPVGRLWSDLRFLMVGAVIVWGSVRWVMSALAKQVGIAD